MPRPRIVHTWDGRLATTRRPFRFFLQRHVAGSPIAPPPIRTPTVRLPHGSGRDQRLAGEMLRVGEQSAMLAVLALALSAKELAAVVQERPGDHQIVIAAAGPGDGPPDRTR
jgi:hypothetical protein